MEKYALMSAGSTLLVSAYLFYRWVSKKKQQALIWGLATFAYFISHSIEYAWMSGIVESSGPMHAIIYFVRQSMVSVMLTLIYYSVVGSVMKSRFFTEKMPIILFSLQEIWLLYADFVLEAGKKIIISPTVHIIVFVIPISLIIGVLFMFYYLKKHNYGSLFVSLSWLIYTLILPFYFITKGTENFALWFLARTFTILLFLFGLILMEATK